MAIQLDQRFGEPWLRQCLLRNRDTEYGRVYRFEEIDSIDDYQARVPVVDYDQLKESIQRIARGDADILFKGPVAGLELTGGSGGGSKLIPYSQQSIEDFKTSLYPWIHGMLARLSPHGRLYWSISPDCRNHSDNSYVFPIGLSDAEYLQPDLAATYLARSAIPTAVDMPENYKDWLLITLHGLIKTESLELVSVWSPSFWLNLLDAIDIHQQLLQKVFLDGFKLADDEYTGDSAALKRLETYLANNDYRALWPELKWISCWCDGSSAYFSDQVLQRMPWINIEPKGLIMTEGVVTIPADDGKMRLSEQGFYEFQDSDGQIKCCEDLVTGTEYRLISTTSGGLYRYLTGDNLKFVGGDSGVGYCFDFIGRGESESDLVGEKLNEEFISLCVEGLLFTVMLLPDQQRQAGYLIMVDAPESAPIAGIAETVERRLCQNPQYRHARTFGQLQPLQAVASPNLLSSFVQFRMKQGQRIGDIKPPILCTDQDWLRFVREKFL